MAAERSASGRHLLATEDISRLRLIKRLVDSDDSVGAMDTVSLDAREACMNQTKL
jgi:hypothetical protein